MPHTLARSLAQFEQTFRYPLGAGWFRIDHGDDYSRFYRTLGDTTTVVAHHQGGSVGVCSWAVRTLERPRSAPLQALYVGDLKIAPRARGARVLWRLARALRESSLTLESAYGVIMHGTSIDPSHYTGRAGVPHFTRVADLSIWRVVVPAPTPAAPLIDAVASSEGEALFRCLAGDSIFTLAGDARLRSTAPVQWFATADRKACGRREDTTRAKQLFDQDGAALVSRHLSAFAFAAPAAGNLLLNGLLEHLAVAHVPALFVALPDDGRELPPLLRTTLRSGASVYPWNLGPASTWNIFTAEI